jgi:hypothetical protein
MLRLPLGRLPNLVEIGFAASRLAAWRLCGDPFNCGADLTLFLLGSDKCTIWPSRVGQTLQSIFVIEKEK